MWGQHSGARAARVVVGFGGRPVLAAQSLLRVPQPPGCFTALLHTHQTSHPSAHHGPYHSHHGPYQSCHGVGPQLVPRCACPTNERAAPLAFCSSALCLCCAVPLSSCPHHASLHMGVAQAMLHAEAPWHCPLALPRTLANIPTHMQSQRIRHQLHRSQTRPPRPLPPP